MKVPVGGDQLTPERLQWAKALRSGAHTSLERFDNLSPMIVELFHTLQDFLEVIYFNQFGYIFLPFERREYWTIW